MKPRREGHTWYETARDMKNVETVAGRWWLRVRDSEVAVHQSSRELAYSHTTDDAHTARARII